MRKESEENLVRFLEDRETLDVEGNALLIFQNGREIFRHYSGKADRDSLYRVYSMTKPITVTAALQLYERGMFEIDEPLWHYLPEYEHMTVWNSETGRTEEAKNPILIRDLFRMTAGLCYGGTSSEPERLTQVLTDEMEKENPGCGYSTREFARRLAGVPLLFEPGTYWHYSYCHDVLAALIEVLSGQRFGEYLKEHIFTPLGMEHTFFRCPADQAVHLMPCRYADGAKEFDDDRFGENARFESGGGGLLSTPDDYMNFALALTQGGTSKNGARILGRKTVDLLRMDQLNDESRKTFDWPYLTGYGYGLGVRTLLSPAAAGIPGTTGEFGWCGVLGTWVLMDPAEQLTAVYMHQRYPNLETFVQRHLRTMIYAALD